MDANKTLFNQLPIPVSFRCYEIDLGAVEYSTQAVSIFHNGFVITSPQKLRKGSLLLVRLRMPPESFGGGFWESRCVGRVVAEHPPNDGELRYRVELVGTTR